MSKRRTVGGLAVGALAVALIGGGTFAGLSDQQSVDNNTLAGATVELGLTNNTGGMATPFNASNLVPVPSAGTVHVAGPGEGRQIKYYVLSNEGTIQANLSLEITGIDASEEDFAEQLFVIPFHHDALGNEPPANNCNFSGAQYKLRDADTAEVWNAPLARPLKDVVDRTWIFENANPMAVGDEECFVMSVHWQDDTNPTVQPWSNNDVMGESATFDLVFDLVQAAP
jgi:predicted ribosomally synthesized peptide with SipW-like signal peptide